MTPVPLSAPCMTPVPFSASRPLSRPLVKSTLRPTPRLSTWKTIPPGECRLGRDIHDFLPRYPSFVNLVAVTFSPPWSVASANLTPTRNCLCLQIHYFSLPCFIVSTKALLSIAAEWVAEVGPLSVTGPTSASHRRLNSSCTRRASAWAWC